MVSYGSSPVPVLAFVILLTKTSVGGGIKRCPANASIDLTGELPDYLGFVKKSGYVFLSNETWTTEGRTFGCRDEVKMYLPLCCPPGEARLNGRCEKDVDTSGIRSRNITSYDDCGVEVEIPEQNYQLFTNDPCTIGWMATSVKEKFIVFKNGSITAPEFKAGSLSDFEQYCLFRYPGSGEYFAKICRPWIQSSAYELYCATVVLFIMLAIFLCYTMVPELKNMHGSMFRCYAATYMFLALCALGVLATAELRINPMWFTFFEITVFYFSASCGMWLNVMSLNIWRSFRYLRPIQCRSKEKERRKMIFYAIYAWCSPVVILGICLTPVNYVPYLRDDVVRRIFKQWVCVAFISTVLLLNIVLQSSTALTIRRLKRDTAYLTAGVNKHYEVEEQWFNLYWKLFMIMGAHIVIWPIWLVVSTPAMTHLLATMELLQAIFIFFIFVWTDTVKRSLRERFLATNVLFTKRPISYEGRLQDI